MDLNMAAIIVGGFLVLKFLEFGLDHFLKKVRKVADNEYITEERCGKCREDQDTSDRSFKREMREDIGQIKGILLVLATGEKVDMDQIAKLISRG